METSSIIAIPPAHECLMTDSRMKYVPDIILHHSTDEAPVKSTKNNVNEKNSHRCKKNRNDCLDAIVEVLQSQDTMEMIETQELLSGNRDKRMELLKNNSPKDDESKITIVTVEEDSQETTVTCEADLDDDIQNPRLMKKIKYPTYHPLWNQRTVKILLKSGITIFWISFLVVLIYGLYATA